MGNEAQGNGLLPETKDNIGQLVALQIVVIVHCYRLNRTATGQRSSVYGAVRLWKEHLQSLTAVKPVNPDKLLQLFLVSHTQRFGRRVKARFIPIVLEKSPKSAQNMVEKCSISAIPFL